jgi:hypothetical protein
MRLGSGKQDECAVQQAKPAPLRTSSSFSADERARAGLAVKGGRSLARSPPPRFFLLLVLASSTSPVASRRSTGPVYFGEQADRQSVVGEPTEAAFLEGDVTIGGFD